MMAAAGTFLVPTIYLGDYYYETQTLRSQDKNDSYIESGRAEFLAAIGRAHKAGVKVVIGLDMGAGAADPTVYAREFAVFVEAGISPMDAIKAGTSVVANADGDFLVGSVGMEDGELALLVDRERRIVKALVIGPRLPDITHMPLADVHRVVPDFRQDLR